VPVARNVAIILALGAGLDLLPGANRGASVIGAALQMTFFAGLGWLGYRTYHERRTAIFSLGDRMRGLLYSSLVVAVLAAASTSRLWETGVGTIVWFALVFAAIYGLMVVLRVARGD